MRFGSSENVKFLFMATWIKFSVYQCSLNQTVSPSPINKQCGVRPQSDPVLVLELYFPIQNILIILSTVEVLDHNNICGIPLIILVT